MKHPDIYLITRLKDFLDEYKPQKYNWGYNSDSKEIFCNVCESVRPYYSPTFAIYINEFFYRKLSQKNTQSLAGYMNGSKIFIILTNYTEIIIKTF